MSRTDFGARHPIEFYDQYAGQCVAWAMDGWTILEHAPNLTLLYAACDARGLKLNEYVVEQFTADWHLFGTRGEANETDETADQVAR